MRLAAGNTTESSTLFAVYVGLKCLQAISTALVFILYIYVVMTLWRKQVYHSNLIVLLMALPVSSLIAVFMTLVLDIVGAFDLSHSPLVDIIEFAVKSGMFGGVLNLPNFILERLAATLLVNKYEQCNNRFPFFSLALVMVQIGLTCLLTYLNTIGLISNLDGVIVFMIVCAVAIVLFSVLPLISRRAYQIHLRRGSAISVRYQTAENLRVARLLNKLMVLYVCFFITENLYYYVVVFVLHYDDVIVQEILLSVFTTLMVAEVRYPL
ncbi:hypothetical protein GCK32_013753 [Trichostrongylus colubriformis]|uniref:Uncharacterized protein n=1 Tax=Trichostrongylus colubriformis TaxID=6319 RepID=A0AAN8FZX6_TRICO